MKLIERADLVRQMILCGNGWHGGQIAKCWMVDDRLEGNHVRRAVRVSTSGQIDRERLENGVQVRSDVNLCRFRPVAERVRF